MNEVLISIILELLPNGDYGWQAVDTSFWHSLVLCYVLLV